MPPDHQSINNRVYTVGEAGHDGAESLTVTPKGHFPLLSSTILGFLLPPPDPLPQGGEQSPNHRDLLAFCI